MNQSETKWEPRFYADEPTNEDSYTDELREQDCCTNCRAYTGDLPGYYYVENDHCPNCRVELNEQKWSIEVLTNAEESQMLDEEKMDNLKEQLAEYSVYHQFNI